MKPNKKKWIGAVGGFLLAVIVSSQVLIGCANNNNHDPSYYGNHFGMNCPTPEWVEGYSGFGTEILSLQICSQNGGAYPQGHPGGQYPQGPHPGGMPGMPYQYGLMDGPINVMGTLNFMQARNNSYMREGNWGPIDYRVGAGAPGYNPCTLWGNYHLTQQAPAHIQGGDIQGLSLIAQGSGGTGAQHVLRVDFRMANISGHYGPSKYLYAEALIYVEGYNCDP